MIERHPFGLYIPPNPHFLLLGSFPPRQAIPCTRSHDPTYDWFYPNPRNQFWRILEAVYDLPLRTKEEKRSLCDVLSLALGDVVLSAERVRQNNADSSLSNITYNSDAIREFIAAYSIQTIFFSGTFPATMFLRHLTKALSDTPNTVILPSPSPRFARMSFTEKVAAYKKALPPFTLHS